MHNCALADRQYNDCDIAYTVHINGAMGTHEIMHRQLILLCGH